MNASMGSWVLRIAAVIALVESLSLLKRFDPSRVSFTLVGVAVVLGGLPFMQSPLVRVLQGFSIGLLVWDLAARCMRPVPAIGMLDSTAGKLGLALVLALLLGLVALGDRARKRGPAALTR